MVKIRANLEGQIHALEKASERLLSIAGPRFEDKVKRDGEFVPLQLPSPYTVAHEKRQILYPPTSRICTPR